MGKFCIVAAKPKNATNHLKSSFKMYERNDQTTKWSPIGWKSIGDVSALMQAGHEVLTGEINGTSLDLGAPVELELRITRNSTDYKISAMPDQ